jgi:hypothetical protein
MAEILWYDYAYPTPDLTGIPGVLRYLNNGSGGRPDLTRTEVDSLLTAGKAIGPIWEKGITASSQGRDRGVADAQAANVEADKLGVPADVVIWYTVDNDYTPTQVTPYFEGVRSVPGRPVGIYGGFVIVEWAASVGIEWRWMAGAWNYGNGVSKYAHLYQRDVNVASGNTKVDRNVWLAPFPVWQGDDPMADPTPAQLKAYGEAAADAVFARRFAKIKNSKDTTSLGDSIVWNEPLLDSVVDRTVSALSKSNDPAAIAQAVLDKLDPDLAKKVIDEMKARL